MCLLRWKVQNNYCKVATNIERKIVIKITRTFFIVLVMRMGIIIVVFVVPFSLHFFVLCFFAIFI